MSRMKKLVQSLSPVNQQYDDGIMGMFSNEEDVM